MKLSRQTAVAAGLALFLAISFSPALRAVAWHFIHGTHIQCADKSILVPFWWFGKLEGRKAYILRSSHSVFSGSTATGMISLWPVESRPKTEEERASAYESFISTYWTYLAGGTGETIGPIRKGNRENETICMQTSLVKQKWISLSCLVFSGSWYGTYYGDPRQAETFYRIVEESR
jgi:hypothetical protein